MRTTLEKTLPALLLVGALPVLAQRVSATVAIHQTAEPAALLTEPGDGFSRVYKFIAGAKKSVDMTMYELNDAQAEHDLAADAHRGVEVRVLLDQDYSGRSYNASAFSFLSRHGVQVKWGPSDTIVHEKSIVVDDERALIATFNLGDTSNYYATTRDFGVFDSTPSDVTSIVQVFDSDWAGTPISAPPTSHDGADLVWSPGSQPTLVGIIDDAQHRLMVENEEMEDSSIVSALAAAAGRGVVVDVVMTYDSSWAPNFNQLVSAGVHVRTYAESANLYIHAKAIVADGGFSDQRMFLGSENFSVSSLDYNRELGLALTTPSIISSVAATVRRDYSHARPWLAKAAAPTSASSQPSCGATTRSANDGYPGDVDVNVTSNQPYTEAKASDSSDTWSHETNGSGDATILLYHQQPGEQITVTVGGASCSATA